MSKIQNRSYIYRGNVVPGVLQRCQASCPDPCGAHTWGFRVELPADGKRRQVARDGFATGRQAADARAKVLADHRAGRLPVDTSVTVSGWLTQWLTDRSGSGALRAATQRSYGDHVTQYLVPRLGQIRLSDLRPEHISAMYRAISAERGQLRQQVAERNAAAIATAQAYNAAYPDRRARKPVLVRVPRPFGATTAQRIHATLRGALNAAMRRGLVTRNAASLAEVPRGARPKVKPWQPDQVGGFLAHVRATNPRMYPLVRLAVMGGLRRGELSGLTWSQVDLDRATVTVDRQRASVGYRVYDSAPKSEASNRVVDIDAGTVTVLRDWREISSLEASLWGQAYRDTGHVFTAEDGAPWHPDRVSKVFARLVRGSGLPPARLHDMRHLAASLRLASGADVAVVSKQLGHSTVSLTSDTYSHLIGGVGRDTSQRAADLVDGTRP